MKPLLVALLLTSAPAAHAVAEADLLVGYDQSYASANGGTANTRVIAANAIAGSNAINERSGTPARVRITGYHQAAQYSYQRTSNGGFVQWMANRDSRLVDVVDAANARGADLVTFVCESTADGAGAVAGQPGRESSFDPASFWSTVVAHELGGHNYGCDHRGGHENPKTVMLHNYCGGGAQGWFSNPNIWLNGIRLRGEGSCLGDAVDGGDNALKVSNAAQGVADRYARVIAAPNLENIVRRWSFNQAPGSAPAGTTITDPITGSALATVQGSGATFTGNGLRIPGGASGSGAAYLQLPGGVISGQTNVTIEIWATPLSAQNWGRVMDFNNGTTNYLTLTSAIGTDLDDQRFEAKVAGTTSTINSAIPTVAGLPHHYAITFADNGSGGGRWRWYRDGDEVAYLDVNHTLAALQDVNNWLGRSAYAGDAFANCEYSEVRISNVAMTRDELLANFMLGPNRQASSVNLTGDNALGQSSFNAGAGWSDGLAPSAAKSYETLNFRLRTPADGVSRTFAGQSLDITGGSLTWKGTASSSITVPDLRLHGSAELLHSGSGTWTLGGSVAVRSDDASVRAANGPITLSANLTGSNSLLFLNNTVTLSGSNSGFAGRMVVGDGRFSAIAIDSEARLGPNPAALVTDQLSFNRGTLQTSGDLTLDDANRGILFDVNGGYFNVTSGTLTLRNPLYSPDLGASVVAGAIGKRGAGTLVLDSPGTTFRGALYVDSGSTTANDGVVRVVNSQVLANSRLIGISNTNTAVSTLELDGTSGAITLPRSELAGRNNTTPAIRNVSGTNNIGGLTMLAGGANHIIQSDSGLLNFTGSIYSGVTGTRTVTFQGNGDIAALSTISELTANQVNVAKQGTGTLTLAGVCSHDGSTTLSGGTLRLNGTLDTATSTLVTAANTTLTGTGTSKAISTIAGIHAPGSAANGTGTQTFSGALTYQAGSKLHWTLAANSIATGSSNRVAAQAVTANGSPAINLILNGPGSTVDFTNGFWAQSRTWTVLTATSMSGQFSLGIVTGDSAGRPLASYGSFQLQQSSAGVTVTFHPLSAAPPSAPSGLTSAGFPGSVGLAWNAAVSASSYNIKRSTVSGGPYETIATGITGTSHLDAPVSNGTIYYYVISAVNQFGESDNSTEIIGIPHLPATIDKADNALPLHQATSWTGGVLPNAFDTARWSGLAGANPVSLGGNVSLRGIIISGTGGAVSIGSGNTLTLGTGGIDMSAATQNLTIASGLAIGAGDQAWSVASGRALTLQTGAFTRSPGATLNLQGAGTVSSSMAGLENINGVIPWATVGSGSGIRFATVSGGNLVAYTGATVNANWTASMASATTNFDVTAGSNTTFGASSRVANTVRYLGAADTLTLGNSGSGAQLITNALVNAGTGTLNLATTSGVTGAGLAAGTTNELILNPANASINVSARVHDSAGGSSAVTIAGANTVIFSGANDYTGLTNVNSGTLRVDGANSLGTAAAGTVVNSGGTLELRANITAESLSLSGNGTSGANAALTAGTGTPWTFGGTVTMTGDSAVGGGASTSLTLSNTVSGPHQLTKANAGSVTLNGANSYSGGTVVNAGTLQIGNVSALGNSNGSLTVNGGSLNLNAQSPTVGALSGTGGVITNLTAGTSTLTTDSSFHTTFSGVLQDGAAGQVLALTKEGSGTLTLGGINTHTGATNVNEGALIVNGSLAAGSVVTVAPGARLGGPGTVSGATSIGGIHTPGTIAGTQNFGSTVGYSATSRLVVEVTGNTTTAGSFDKVAATGAVTVSAGAKIDVVLNAAGSTVALNDPFWREAHSWTILTTPALGGSFELGVIGVDPAGRPAEEYGAFSLQQNATSVVLVFTPSYQPTPHEVWLQAHFGEDWDNPAVAGDDIDGDHDGVGNLLERAFGGDPNVAETDLLPKIDDQSERLSIIYRKSLSAADLQVEIQESGDLTSPWIPSEGSQTIISEGATVQHIRFTRPAGSDEKLFLRILVTRP